MKKTRMASGARKRRVVDAIIDVVSSGERFLLVGHEKPDEDCVASMVAFSLLLGKFRKTAHLILRKENQDSFPYLVNICRYNAIRFLGSPEEIDDRYDVVMAFDTPKPKMLEFRERVAGLMEIPSIRVVEIDHHLEADGEYIGESGLSLVDEASSSCELIGYLIMRLSKKRSLLRRYRIHELFTRNLVLAIITGIVADSKMGKYLKSRRERRYYRHFSGLFDEMLGLKTHKGSGNFESIQDIFNELDKLSEDEGRCYRAVIAKSREFPHCHAVTLDAQEMKALHADFDMEIIVTVARYAADNLAEKSGYFGLVAYPDPPEVSHLIQFRMRRSQGYRKLDLRDVIERFAISNGGGHEGAIGFRLPAVEVEDLDAYVEMLISGTEEMIAEADP